MGKLVAFLYGIVAYLVFAIVIVYAIGFVCGLAVPKTIDSGPTGPLVESILINLVPVSYTHLTLPTICSV